MSRRTWIAVAAAAVLVAAVGFWLGWPKGPDAPATEPSPDRADRDPQPDTERSTWSAELYFPGDGERLFAERRELPDGEPLARAEALVSALLGGPRAQSGTSLRSPLPDGTLLGGVYLLDGGTAVVDLTSADAQSGPPSVGSKRELLAVYSLVNTLTLGVDGVERVLLTWNGRQPETFGGHVDTRLPLAADEGYIDRR